MSEEETQKENEFERDRREEEEERDSYSDDPIIYIGDDDDDDDYQTESQIICHAQELFEMMDEHTRFVTLVKSLLELIMQV